MYQPIRGKGGQEEYDFDGVLVSYREYKACYEYTNTIHRGRDIAVFWVNKMDTQRDNGSTLTVKP